MTDYGDTILDIMCILVSQIIVRDKNEKHYG